ncbi:MAG: hypothetical protein FJY07_12600 [Bacteroidetes bacterium]|nr:hypothetical protein [Bacteroidota bacterium]
MNIFELTKSQKKIARQIINKGLEKEFQTGLLMIRRTLNAWSDNKISNGDAWRRIYKESTDYDKHISRRYDDMTGSKYIYVIAAQLADGVIGKQDIEAFDGEIRSAILLLSGVEK